MAFTRPRAICKGYQKLSALNQEVGPALASRGKVSSRLLRIFAPPELTSQMPLNGLLANSENLSDLGRLRVLLSSLILRGLARAFGLRIPRNALLRRRREYFETCPRPLAQVRPPSFSELLNFLI